MEILDKEEQFQINPITLPDNKNFFVIVGRNNSGKSTLLRAIIKNQEEGSSYLVNVNRTVLTGEGPPLKNYKDSYNDLTNIAASRDNDNYLRETQPLQDLFNLRNEERQEIVNWYNNHFPKKMIEERENVQNDASSMLLKIDGFPITTQGSGIRATLEIFIKLFDPSIKILCIDEPELGLEPSLQKYLFRALKERASSDKKIIIATHSHHFLDLEDVGSNYVCKRNSGNKISITKVEDNDLQSIIFRLLGNSLSSFLLPEKIIILEGPSDATFLDKCLSLLSKQGFAIHDSGGNGNQKYAINSITQFLKFNKNKLPVYKDKIFVLADKSKDINTREWTKLLKSEKRVKILKKGAIEYYYPEHILQSIFNTKYLREKIIKDYLKNDPNGFNGQQISKTDLAELVAEKIKLRDIDEKNNELFDFLRNLP